MGTAHSFNQFLKQKKKQWFYSYNTRPIRNILFKKASTSVGLLIHLLSSVNQRNNVIEIEIVFALPS